MTTSSLSTAGPWIGASRSSRLFDSVSELWRGQSRKSMAVSASVLRDLGFSNQDYFWLPEWQLGEEEATEDLRFGRYETFSSMEDALSALKHG